MSVCVGRLTKQPGEGVKHADSLGVVLLVLPAVSKFRCALFWRSNCSTRREIHRSYAARCIGWLRVIYDYLAGNLTWGEKNVPHFCLPEMRKKKNPRNSVCTLLAEIWFKRKMYFGQQLVAEAYTQCNRLFWINYSIRMQIRPSVIRFFPVVPCARHGNKSL